MGFDIDLTFGFWHLALLNYSILPIHVLSIQMLTITPQLVIILIMYYELAFFTHPQLDEKDRVAEVTAMGQLLIDLGAEIKQTLAPESRPLGYGIKKMRQGWLHGLIFTIIEPARLNDLPAKIRLRPHILRFTTRAHRSIPDFAKLRSTLAAARAENRKSGGSGRAPLASRGGRRSFGQRAAAPATPSAPVTSQVVTQAKTDAAATAPKKRKKAKNIDETIDAMVEGKVEV